MKHRLVAAAAATLVLAAPSAASAAELVAEPQKPCYGAGETINLVGTGFTPSGGANIASGSTSIGSLNTDAAGNFSGELTLGLRRGKETRTYTATDAIDPTITASAQITVSAVDVNIKPKSGAPGREVTIDAQGFTGGRTLWAHVVRGSSKRNIRIGRLQKPCHVLEKKKRLLPQNAAIGVYIVQFDNFRKYKARRPQSVGFSITVRRVFRPAAAGLAWSRLF